MGIRTTPDLVKGILLNDYNVKQNPDLTPFITSASSLVDRCVTYAAKIGILITDTGINSQMELVERWLSAHFYAINDRPYKSRSAQGASGSLDGNTGMNLQATLYGQTALMVDPTTYLGIIAAGGMKIVGGFWAGYRPSLAPVSGDSSSQPSVQPSFQRRR